MFRLASVLAIGCLAFAAAALLTASKTNSDKPEQDNENDRRLPGDRLATLPAGHTPSFHARFSLN
jgi:hypothetical protein